MSSISESEWIERFVLEMENLGGSISSRRARTLASGLYLTEGALDPEEVARAEVDAKQRRRRRPAEQAEPRVRPVKPRSIWALRRAVVSDSSDASES